MAIDVNGRYFKVMVQNIIKKTDLILIALIIAIFCDKITVKCQYFAIFTFLQQQNFS